MISTLTAVASNNQSVPFFSLNTAIRERVVHNNSSGALYVAFSNVASPNRYTFKLNPGDTLTTRFNGDVYGCWLSGNVGNAILTETL